MTSDEAREAIEVLEVAEAEVEWNYPLDYAINIDLAIEALKKEVSKKPYLQQDEQGNDCLECPNCDSFIGYSYDCKDEHYQINYCPYCGQRIDWEEEKMTNYEKYKDEILKALFVIGNVGLSKENHKITRCDDLICEKNCGLSIDEYGNCPPESIQNWLDSEYVEPKKEEVDWSKVPIDTKILVSTDEINWYRRYFAGIDRCTNERLAWLDGATSWANRSTRAWKHVKLYKEDEE